MKAFLAAVLAIAVIAIGAPMALEHAGFSSAEMFSTADVRLGD